MSTLTKEEVVCLLHNTDLGTYAEIALRKGANGAKLSLCTETEIAKFLAMEGPDDKYFWRNITNYIENGVPPNFLAQPGTESHKYWIVLIELVNYLCFFTATTQQLVLRQPRIRTFLVSI